MDAAHKQFMAALASLYLKHNTDETISLVIIWALILYFLVTLSSEMLKLYKHMPLIQGILINF